MTDLGEIAANPDWLPHEINHSKRQVRFLKIDRSRIKERDFLANLTRAEAEAWVSFDDVMAMKPENAPVSFIFHSGFCRSTLLLHALDVPRTSLGLNEPGVLNSLAGGGSVTLI